MKKTTKTIAKRSANPPKSHTGVTLLVCFLIASVAVAIAIRQLILERQFRTENSGYLISTNPLVGSYRVTIPDSKSRQRIITLKLDEKRGAVLTQERPDSKDPIVQNGSWSGDSNGTIIVTLGEKAFAFSYSPADSGSLKLLNPDVEVWGAATLTLVKD